MLHTLSLFYLCFPQDFNTDAFHAFCVLASKDKYEAEVGKGSANLGFAPMPNGLHFLDMERNSGSTDRMDNFTTRYVMPYVSHSNYLMLLELLRKK